jgi:hypothetical protein
MEQKDYLMREIEKIGLLLRAVLDSLIHRKENLSLKIDNHFDDLKEMLNHQTGFGLNHLMLLDEAAARDYISQFHGMNSENLELLAEIIFQSAISAQADQRRMYLEKAILLYELCRELDKTYSPARANKIKEIKRAL